MNRVVKTDSYPLPRIEDLFASLCGGQLFSKLYLAHAYQQIPLDEDSQLFTTINTHKGLYCYNRLPFGVASAPAILKPGTPAKGQRAWFLEIAFVWEVSMCVYVCVSAPPPGLLKIIHVK